jgi:hypothetical protein
MRLELRRKSIEVHPKSIADELYIEQVLGLARNGDSIALTRLSIDAGASLILD